MLRMWQSMWLVLVLIASATITGCQSDIAFEPDRSNPDLDVVLPDLAPILTHGAVAAIRPKEALHR